MGNFDAYIATPESATNIQGEYLQKQIHTALPARVIKFDAEKQTVTASLFILQQLTNGAEQISPLLDVPVIFPKGGGFCFTFPLKEGDEGLILFAERCIDGWWQTGQAKEPLDLRLHDYSDAMFIPGVSSLPNVITPFFKEGLSMQTLSGDIFIRLTKENILIKGDIYHQGNITSTGIVQAAQDVTTTAVSLNNHIHPGDSGGTTGTPL